MIKQTQDNIKLEKKKAYVFEHKRTGRIEGTNLPKQAKILKKSPSWEVIKEPKKGEEPKE
jgi:hypothetical protein